MNWPIIIAAIIALLGTVASVAGAIYASRRTGVTNDRERTSEDMWEIVERVQDDNTRQRERIDLLEQRYDEMRTNYRKEVDKSRDLEYQVIELRRENKELRDQLAIVRRSQDELDKRP